MSGKSSSSPTQGDVAKALGLSQSTVSLALRDDSRISEDRRKTIQTFASAMGYKPSSAAVSMAHRRHSGNTDMRGDVLGWINYWDDPSYLHRFEELHQYFLGACETADKLGYTLQEFSTKGKISPKRFEKILTARGIKGILLPPHPVNFNFEDFDWNQFSFIKIGYSIAHPPGHIVSSHHAYNNALTFEKILEKGYKRIGFVEGITTRYSLFDAGFLRAQRAVPAKDRLPIFSYNHNHLLKTKTQLKKWVTRFKPDAIITESEMIPWFLMDIGYRIPEDIGIAATTIRDGGVDAGIDQNPSEIGRVGVLSLISQLHDSDRGIPGQHREVLVKGRWVDGNSLPSRK